MDNSWRLVSGGRDVEASLYFRPLLCSYRVVLGHLDQWLSLNHFRADPYHACYPPTPQSTLVL